MRKIRIVCFALFLAAVLLVPVIAQSDAGCIFQVSTMAALKQGEYEGFIAFNELGRRGDFGIGTVNGLDGEMICADGKFYQITADGKVHSIDDSVLTPFATVTFFKPDAKATVQGVNSVAALQELLNSNLRAKDTLPYAIRIEGHFKYMKVRSVPKQAKPSPGLEEVVKHQTIFELRDVPGIMVGFRFPSYIGDVNASGFHFHFITVDRNAGGHVLDCDVEKAEVASQAISGLQLVLPEK